MKKTHILISCILLSFLTWAGNSPNKKEEANTLQPTAEMVTLTCIFDNCSSLDSIKLYKSSGYFKEPIMTAYADKNGQFIFQLPKSKSPQFYFVGLNAELDKLKPIILGTEKTVTLSGPCYNMMLTNAKESKLNEGFDNAFRQMNTLKINMSKAAENMQLNYNDVKLRTEFENQIKAVDVQKLALLDSLKKSNPFVAKILALDTYTSFQHSPNSKNFKDEIEYFATQYFQYVNWQDTEYEGIPYIFDMFRSYTNVITLPQLGLSKDKQKSYINGLTKNIPAKSQAHKFALSGIFSILLEKQNTLAIDYVETYMTQFPNDDPNYMYSLRSAVNQLKAQMLEVPAPEIVQADTTGKMRKLSDMKGKYVLIDFWASWCGPCRRENPNVVRLYNRYKDKGFDVFSVSLDQSRDRWIQAIKDDGLLWDNHVSDLKYWSNEAARTYGIQSIPSTLLLDKNGLIIARNLRGPALENKLAELLGQ